MYAIAGRPPGSIRTDEEAWSIVHPEDRERVLEIHRQALAPEGDGNFYSEHRIVRPNGEVRWIIWQGRTFFRETPSGRTPIRRLGACIDITERKLTEIELTRSQNKFSKMINASPHGIAITTFAEGRYLDASPAEFFLTGFRREEIIGRRVLDINFYEDPEDSRNIRRLLTEHGSINNYRFRFRKKSGELRWGLFSAGIIEFEGQKCILSAVSDMTDLHDAEEALKLSEERLRMATEGASIGWWDWDIKSGAVTCNDIYYTMLGYAPQEFPLSFERWKELLFPDDREAILPRLNRVLSGNLPVFSVEFRIKCKDGGWRWVQGIGRVFERDADDGAVRAIGIHADIHERKMAEEELLRANQELEARVKQRTATLEALNESLQNEIASRQAVEDKLRAKTEELAEINNALRVVLRKSREESDEIATKIFTDIRELALPFLEKLKLTSPKGRQAAYLQLLEEALSEITSSEPTSLLDLQRKLTPGEYQVAVLIRQGRTSKQLAEILSLSCRTIESHRKSIRKKLGLQNRKANLRSHLASIGNDRLKY
jgi:PAS domain S-box-containing protein